VPVSQEPSRRSEKSRLDQAAGHLLSKISSQRLFDRRLLHFFGIPIHIGFNHPTTVTFGGETDNIDLNRYIPGDIFIFVC
jgi:hypothetical protein